MARRARQGRHHGRGGGMRKPKVEIGGKLRMLGPGRASISTEEGSFAVAKGGIREAMDGDEVRAIIVSRGTQRLAVVRSVVNRATSSFVGRYATVAPLGVVEPLDARMRHDFFVLPEDQSASRLGVKEGDVVVARILEYPARGSSGVVTIERRMGPADELALDMEAVIASFGLRTKFSAAVLDEAKQARDPAEMAQEGGDGRRDLRSTLAVTIDPDDARDYDDAVGGRRVDGGYELDVHIADVTSYVPWDSSMDLEARQRTCSVYLADRVIPMLPERLSSDLCSLRPGLDRLCMSVRMRLDRQGRVLGAEAFPSLIRSTARLSYRQVDSLFEGALAPCDLPCEDGREDEVAALLHLLDKIARLRQSVRRQRGAIDFDTPEAKVRLDASGRPLSIEARKRTAATSLVEEAMLLANECVAAMLAEADVSSAYRTHERPAPEDLKDTATPLLEAGLIDGPEAARLAAGEPALLQDILDRARGTSYEHLANALLLRAQKRAVYLPHNEGHYALGARAYCHFTSPIRRYPDTLVHRALKALLAGKLDTREQRQIRQALPQLCRSCSDQERVADAAARQSQDVKMAQYYGERLGERHGGIIVGCERFGLFVMLEDSCAEGLVPARDLSDGWVSYDPERRTLVEDATGRVFRMGMRVAVEIARVDVARGRIDLKLLGL